MYDEIGKIYIYKKSKEYSLGDLDWGRLLNELKFYHK